ncbi:protein kinase [bacterium]
MVGKTISHYKIIKELGRGGMGIVYKAEDSKLKRLVALKFLSPVFIQDVEAKQRFIHEARAAALLNHPNICTIYEIDEVDDHLFIAMEFIQGQTLQNLLKSGPFPIDQMIPIGTQICSGLHAAHQHGIIHRDIKSANIMITENGQVKIMDFGLAQSFGQTRLTKEGSSLGTVAYMSFEQACGQEVDHRTDIWSLGVVLYEMITGKLPFPGDVDQVVIYSILNKEPNLISDLKSGIPSQLERIINRTLEKDLNKRYQNAQEIGNDLNKVNKSKPLNENAGPLSQPKTGRHPLKWSRKVWLGLTALFIILVFLGIGRVIFQNKLSAPPKPIAVISFENQTGDAAYDYLRKAIPNLLITNLEQSPHFNVTSWERMHDLLKQMGKADVELIEKETGFELCHLEGIQTIVLGSFIKADNIFATDIKVLDVQSKQLMASASSRGNGVGSILENQIDELSNSISLGVGLSEKMVESTSTRIMDVTTTSMEAYKHFLKGREYYERNYLNDAQESLEKAIGIDTTFAVAYLYLSFVSEYLRNVDKSKAVLKKAKLYASTATEKERLYIDANYAGTIERRWEERRQILRKLKKKYPREKQAYHDLGWDYQYSKRYVEAAKEFNTVLKFHPQYGPALNGLAHTYGEMGDYEKAIVIFKQYSEMFPGDANPIASMGELYLLMGRLDEAIGQFNEAVAIKPDITLHQYLAYTFALQENYSTAIEVLDQFISNASTPGLKGQGCFWKGIYLSWCGRYHNAIEALDRAESFVNSMGNEYGVAVAHMIRAFIHYERNNFELSKRGFERWSTYCQNGGYASDPGASILGFGLIDIKDGNIDDAKSKLHDMNLNLVKLKENKDPDYMRNLFIKNLYQMELLLAEGALKEAINMGEKNTRIEFRLGTRRLIAWNIPFQQDALARAYFANGELDKAIQTYEDLITFTPGKKDLRLINPIYRYRLAKLYEGKGWPGKAIEQYQNFLEIWRDADNDLPEFIDAKARLFELKSKGK